MKASHLTPVILMNPRCPGPEMGERTAGQQGARGPGKIPPMGRGEYPFPPGAIAAQFEEKSARAGADQNPPQLDSLKGGSKMEIKRGEAPEKELVLW